MDERNGKIIYVVTNEDDVTGLFSARENAEEVCRRLCNDGHAHVTGFELDACVNFLDVVWKLYLVELSETDGEVVSISVPKVQWTDGWIYRREGGIHIPCFARNIQHATEVAWKEREKFLQENPGRLSRLVSTSPKKFW